MFYQVLIELIKKESNSPLNKKIYELDFNNKEDILEEIIIPYLTSRQFQFDGYFLNKDKVDRISVYQTNMSSKSLSKTESEYGIYIPPEGIFDYKEHLNDISREIFKEGKKIIKKTEDLDYNMEDKEEIDKSKIFIVHGHDESATESVARLIEKLKLEPIILREQANKGKTIIEKIEE
jgi:hypothetical protein